MNYRRGDIVLVHSDGIVAWIIRKVQSRGHVRRVYVNHVMLVTDSMGSVVDAQPPRVTLEHVDKYKGHLIAIYRPRNLTDAQRAQLAVSAEKYVGRLYGITKILLHLVGLARWSSVERWPICSWTVAQPYSALGLTFDVSGREADPDDIYAFCAEHPAIYECVKPLGVL